MDSTIKHKTYGFGTYNAQIDDGYESDYASDGGTVYKPTSHSHDLKINFFFLGRKNTAFQLDLSNIKLSEVYIYIKIDKIYFYKNHQVISLSLTELPESLIDVLCDVTKNQDDIIECIEQHSNILVRLIQNEPNGYNIYPKSYIGSGTYCNARLFTSENQTVSKTKVILSPHSKESISTVELTRKCNFYLTLYPEYQPTIKIYHNDSNKITDYRCIIPQIHGVKYTLLPARLDLEEVLKIFMSAIDATILAHKKGLIMIDLNAENIIYNSTEQKSYLIDGGFAIKTGEFSPAELNCDNIESRNQSIAMFSQIAPECWYIKDHAIYPCSIVTEAMDVFSLVNFLWKYLLDRSSEKPSDLRLNELLLNAAKHSIWERPTLMQLRTAFIDAYPELFSQNISPTTDLESCASEENEAVSTNSNKHSP